MAQVGFRLVLLFVVIRVHGRALLGRSAMETGLKYLLAADWPLAQREEYTVSENWLVRRIFGPEQQEVNGGWRKLHNDELYHTAYIKYKSWLCVCVCVCLRL